MPLLVIWGIVKDLLGGAVDIAASILSTPTGRTIVLSLAGFVVGDWYGAHSERAATEKAAYEARLAAQARDLRVADDLAKMARSQSAESDKAKADALAALEEIRTHANDRSCALSEPDARRLQRIR